MSGNVYSGPFHSVQSAGEEGTIGACTASSEHSGCLTSDDSSPAGSSSDERENVRRKSNKSSLQSGGSSLKQQRVRSSSGYSSHTEETCFRYESFNLRKMIAVTLLATAGSSFHFHATLMMFSVILNKFYLLQASQMFWAEFRMTFQMTVSRREGEDRAEMGVR